VPLAPSASTPVEVNYLLDQVRYFLLIRKFIAAETIWSEKKNDIVFWMRVKVIVRTAGNCNRFDDSGDHFGLHLMILDPALIIGPNYIPFFFGCNVYVHKY